ncbi:hypothetical protein EDD98_7595 [Streptomyces sp. PanSC19]|uniref:hypothetical protein n=1 Tax=Streptomyces sp. PanSC19 TaxID=1520455 RepID=UPI000F48C9E0|nr:hypothetical protein [Streptomyces sp. PanSC19]ROQ23146.1 hypothetical protein EDD98_7595 [Streptomyces sp. PanSC19]
MSTITTSSEASLFLEPVATERARRRVEELMADFRTGSWQPTRLEGRIAELLLASTAGDGMLTPRRIRAALWEGNIALTHENDGRFAQVLADLVPVLDDPQLTALDLVDAAGELVGAVASTAAVVLAA